MHLAAVTLGHQSRVWIPALPLTGCAALGKWLELSVPMCVLTGKMKMIKKKKKMKMMIALSLNASSDYWSVTELARLQKQKQKNCQAEQKHPYIQKESKHFFYKEYISGSRNKETTHYHWGNHQPVQVSSQAWFIMPGAIHQHTGLRSELWTNRHTSCKMVLDAKSAVWICLHYNHLLGCYKQVYTIYRVLENGNPLQYSGLENPMDGGAW